MTSRELETWSGWSGWSGTARLVRGNDVVEEVSAGFATGPDGPAASPQLRYQAGSISKLVVSVTS